MSTKSLTDIPSTGNSPRLASGATDNTGASLLSGGDVVDRVVSGSVESSMTDSFAYGADAGSLTAMGGSADGSVSFTFAGDESGTYDSLVVTEESDYQLLDSTGLPTTFQSSIYYPGLYKGFKARIFKKPVADLAVGANSFQLQHSANRRH